MARAFCIPGVLFLFCAFVLLFLVSISLPYLTALDFVRVHFAQGGVISGRGMVELRFGIWSACWRDTGNARTCLDTHHGYSIEVINSQNNGGTVIGSAWTRGLAIHPVACAVTFIALVMSFSQHVTWTLMSSLTSFLAAALTLIAFAVDIALLAYVRNQMGEVPGISSNTDTAAAFWMTFVSLILLLLAGCTVCFGRRKDRMSGAYPSYPMSTTTGKKGFFSRFRRNR